MPLLRFFLVSFFIVAALCSPIIISYFKEKDTQWLHAPLNQDEEKYKQSFFRTNFGGSI
ncbi:MAG: hypothetical protein LRY27_00745 [Chitinophagales bacterium]|nr:hypothetical protein [Chitinophagales bacterium]